MPYSKQELLEARRQISSTLHKLEETVRTLEGKENPARCKPQITLAKRRIQAFTIAMELIGLVGLLVLLFLYNRKYK